MKGDTRTTTGTKANSASTNARGRRQKTITGKRTRRARRARTNRYRAWMRGFACGIIVAVSAMYVSGCELDGIVKAIAVAVSGAAIDVLKDIVKSILGL